MCVNGIYLFFSWGNHTVFVSWKVFWSHPRETLTGYFSAVAVFALLLEFFPPLGISEGKERQSVYKGEERRKRSIRGSPLSFLCLVAEVANFISWR